jgi:formylglycine-generating enzyme required for sulfatase activity
MGARQCQSERSITTRRSMMIRWRSAAAAVAPLALTATTVSPQPAGKTPLPGFVPIPGGSFEMGDHQGFVDPRHGSDETPIHKRSRQTHRSADFIEAGGLTSMRRLHELS